MSRVTSMSLCVAFLLVMVFNMNVHHVESAVFLVGDANGWTNVGENYTTWAANQTIRVGDTLVFVNKNTYEHTVDVLTSQADYMACNFNNNAIPLSPGTNVTIAVPSSAENGMFYVACSVPGHCLGGMKLAVPVLAALSGVQPTPPPPATTSPPPPTTPSNPGPYSTGGAKMNTYIFYINAILPIGTCFSSLIL